MNANNWFNGRLFCNIVHGAFAPNHSGRKDVVENQDIKQLDASAEEIQPEIKKKPT